MCRIVICGLAASALVLVLALASVAPAASQAVCRPKLSVTGVQFSEMIPPTLERRWTATVSVDASRCAINTGGTFEIGFLRIKENGTDLEFREQFIWLPPSVKVSVDFWADEAVQQYWIDKIAPCVCRD